MQISQLSVDIISQIIEYFESKKPFEVEGREYNIIDYGSYGEKGLVLKAKDQYNSKVAIKITIPKEYQSKSILDEIELRNKLEEYYENFTRFRTYTIESISIDGNVQDFICFIEDWVNGKTLKDYLEENTIDVYFLRAFIRFMCDSLCNLRYCSLCHNDLHAGNIMIENPKKGTLLGKQQEYKFKIVDMGSLKSCNPDLENYTKKWYTDLYWFIDHIVKIHNKIIKSKLYSNSEKKYLDAIINRLDSILEKDHTRSIKNPSRIFELFESDWLNCLNSDENYIFSDPFNFISAENIQNDKLLVEIFADSWPFKDNIINPDPLILTGPRGCGKSTVFRRLSLKSMLYAGNDELRETQIVGFYFSCSYDLKNRVNWIYDEKKSLQMKNSVLHLFNLLLIREIVHTFDIISKREDREKLFSFSEFIERDLFKFLGDELKFSDKEFIKIQGVPYINRLFEIINYRINDCQKAIYKNSTAENITEVNSISNITDWLSNNVPYFKNKKIVFFIDDLSTRQIPSPVQEILGDVIFQRAKSHVFKISSDKNGLTVLDLKKTNWEINREFREFDCGKEYFELEKAKKINFTKELLDKRLSAAKYSVSSIEKLIGNSYYEKGSLGAQIRYNKDNKNRNVGIYHGIETISELCAGDISVLLDIFRRIFIRANVDSQTTTPIPHKIQHDEIKAVSDAYLEQIKSYHPYGSEMLEIVTEFGTLGKKILREGKQQTIDDKLIPNQCPRIEVDRDPRKDLELSDKLFNIDSELKKRSIFIQMKPSSSRHGSGLSYRLNIRPIFIPSFYMAISKNAAIKWSLEEYKQFLRNPKSKCLNEFDSRWSDSKINNSRKIYEDQSTLPKSDKVN